MKVFVARRLPPAWIAALSARADLDVEIWPEDTPPPRAALVQAARGVHGLLCLLSDAVDEALLDAAGPQLRVVSQMAVGVDNIDVAACAARGIPVGHTPGVLVDATADLTMALLLSAARRLPESAAHLRAGRWGAWRPAALLGRDLAGATLGVVGLGAIGAAVAHRAAAFGMDICYWSRREKPDAPGRYLPLAALLAEADFVSLHVALTPDTHHLIDAAALARMRPDAWLINTARGGVVDTEALLGALRGGRIGGAALDVFEGEPIGAEHPLLTFDNVIALPHIGSATQGTRRRMAERAVQNLLAGLEGAPLPWPVIRADPVDQGSDAAAPTPSMTSGLS